MGVKKILIVDDDPIFCFILEKQLPADIIPYTYIFNKAQEALSFIEEENSNDTKFLIFLDLNMPMMNGLEFLDKVKTNKQNFDLKVVIITSSINREDKIKPFSYSEVIGFLEKPISQRDVQKIIAAF